jgi:23S rRNA (uracil1939-C5)-methyltransferase
VASPQELPKPKRGDTAQAHVESLNHEGQGVAHVEGKAVFIQDALPGEDVIFRYHNKRKSYDTGGLLEVIKPSPDRVTPRCRHFGVCGGCSLQHLRPEAQIEAKQRVLLDALTHIGKLAPKEVLPPISGPAWGYRRKARLGARLVPKKGGVLVGFREKRSSYITSLEQCETLHPRIGGLLPALRALIAGLSIADRVPQIEVAVGDTEAALVFRHLESLTEQDTEALVAFGQAHTVQVYLQPGGPATVYPLWPASPASLAYTLAPYGLELFFGPTDFIQVNAAVNEQMIARALALLDPQPHERVLDLFCGLGNFTLPLARYAGHVVGVEADAQLLDKARANALHNRLTNVEFQQADLYEQGEGFAGFDFEREHFDKWLLDPPRTGALDIVKRLPEDGPQRIVYASCYPGTLARDAAVLVHVKGYELVSAGVMDMFPHTSHVESVALFEKYS